jgi:hypothetical protein
VKWKVSEKHGGKTGAILKAGRSLSEAGRCARAARRRDFLFPPQIAALKVDSIKKSRAS